MVCVSVSMLSVCVCAFLFYFFSEFPCVFRVFHFGIDDMSGKDHKINRQIQYFFDEILW